MRHLLRPLTFVAVLLVLAGLYVSFLDVSYSTQSQVMKIGDFEATVEERHTIPRWVGIVAIVGGLAILAGALRPRPNQPRAPSPPPLTHDWN